MINSSYHQLCFLQEPLLSLCLFLECQDYMQTFQSHSSRTHPQHHPTILEQKEWFFFSFIKRLATPPRSGLFALLRIPKCGKIRMNVFLFLAHSTAYTAEIFLISFGSNLSKPRRQAKCISRRFYSILKLARYEIFIVKAQQRLRSSCWIIRNCDASVANCGAFASKPFLGRPCEA